MACEMFERAKEGCRPAKVLVGLYAPSGDVGILICISS